MNKRLEQLTIEANDQTGNEFDLNHKPLDAFLEKFSELIVSQMLDITDAHTEVFRTDRDRALIEHIKQSVKQHFGVEE